VAEEVEEEGRNSVLVAVAVAVEVAVAADQVEIHIDMENHLTDKNCSGMVIFELAEVEHLDKTMNVVAVG